MEAVAEQLEPRAWTVFGVDKGPDYPTRFMHMFDDPRAARMARPDLPVVELILTEDADGDYAGFIRTGTAGLCMIEHHRIFNMQFPYGMDAATRNGDGEAVRLRAELLTSAASPSA